MTPPYDTLHVGAGPAGRCQVRGCTRGECLTRLRVCSAAVCADHPWECCTCLGESWCSTSGCLCGLPSAGGNRGGVVAVLRSSGLLRLCGDGRSDRVVASGRSGFVMPQLPTRATPPGQVWIRWASLLRELLLYVAGGRHAARGHGHPLGAGMARCLSLALAGAVHGSWSPLSSVDRSLAGRCLCVGSSLAGHACGSHSSASGTTPGRSSV